MKSSEAAAAAAAVATVCEAAAATMKPAEVSRAEEKMTGQNIRSVHVQLRVYCRTHSLGVAAFQDLLY